MVGVTGVNCYIGTYVVSDELRVRIHEQHPRPCIVTNAPTTVEDREILIIHCARVGLNLRFE